MHAPISIPVRGFLESCYFCIYLFYVIVFFISFKTLYTLAHLNNSAHTHIYKDMKKKKKKKSEDVFIYIR